MKGKINTTLLRIAFFVYLAVLLNRIIPLYINKLTYVIYYDWVLSEWMINYEGGFVRRGLVGQIFMWMYNIHPFALKTVVVAIGTTAFLLLLWLTVRLFRRQGWSPVILLSTAMPFAAFFTVPMWPRRDHISLLLAWLIFYIFSHILPSSNGKPTPRKLTTNIVILNTLCAFTLLMHEAAFFYTVLPLMVYYAFYQRRIEDRGWMASMTRSVCMFAIPIVVMALCCIFKGSMDIANSIWASWSDAFVRYPNGGSPADIGWGVHALSWNLPDTAELHFEASFYSKFRYAAVAPFFVVFFYYAITRLNAVNLHWYTLRRVDTAWLSTVLAMTLCCCLPLYFPLSCDWGRTIPYWLFTTLLLYVYLPPVHMARWIERYDSRIQAFINRVPLLASPWTYYAVMVVMPVSLTSFGMKYVRENVLYYLSLL